MNIVTIANKRHDQLQREEKLDNILLEKCSDCQNILLDYTMWRRKVNREQFDRTHNSSFFQWNNEANKNIEETDQHFNELEKHIKNNNNMCKVLKNMVEKNNC